MEQQLMLAAGVAGGVIFGFLVAWFNFRSDRVNIYARGKADGDQERAALSERLAGREARLRELTQERDDCIRQLEALRMENAALQSSQQEAARRLEEVQRSADDKLALVLGLANEIRDNVGDTVRSFTAEALEEGRQAFLELANSLLEKQRERTEMLFVHRDKAYEEALLPFTNSVRRLEEALRQAAEERRSELEIVSGGIQRLSAQLAEVLGGQRPVAEGRVAVDVLDRVREETAAPPEQSTESRAAAPARSEIVAPLAQPQQMASPVLAASAAPIHIPALPEDPMAVPDQAIRFEVAETRVSAPEPEQAGIVPDFESGAAAQADVGPEAVTEPASEAAETQTIRAITASDHLMAAGETGERESDRTLPAMDSTISSKIGEDPVFELPGAWQSAGNSRDEQAIPGGREESATARTGTVDGEPERSAPIVLDIADQTESQPPTDEFLQLLESYESALVAGAIPQSGEETAPQYAVHHNGQSLPVQPLEESLPTTHEVPSISVENVPVEAVAPPPTADSWSQQGATVSTPEAVPYDKLPELPPQSMAQQFQWLSGNAEPTSSASTNGKHAASREEAPTPLVPPEPANREAPTGNGKAKRTSSTNYLDFVKV